MQVVDKYGNTFGQGHLIITSKSGKSKLPVVTVAWGNITGALIDQTDLQDALNLKVPTARTITINGVTQDLTANRTWTISTGITVDTTPITGGVSGRLLFDNAGVVGETNGAFWNVTNQRFGIGTTNPVLPLHVVGGTRLSFTTTSVVHGWGNTLLDLVGNNGTNPGVNEGRLHIGYNQNDPELRVNSGGVMVYTGKWTFIPQIWFAGGITSTHNTAITIDGMSNGVSSGTPSEIFRFTQRGGQFGSFYDAGGGLSEFRIWRQTDNTKYIYLKPGSTSIVSSGSLLINSTTDAGYKLDVNGTIRAKSDTYIGYENIAAGSTYIQINPDKFNSKIIFNDFDGGTGTRGGILEMSTYKSRLTYGSYNWFYIGDSINPFMFYIAPSTGNFVLTRQNTQPTDAGYKLDVGGTGRFSNTLTIQTTATGGSPSNSILISTNDTGNGGRISWGDSNTSILRYSNSLYFREYTGNFVFESTSANAIYFSIRPGGTTLSAGPFTTNSSITAASAIARGAYFNNTLTASANNDVLVGLDINPTFTNGAFTGVTNIAARIGGNVLLTQGPKTISIAAPSTSGNGGELTIAAGNATTAGTGGNISLQPGNGAGGPGAGTVIISNTSWWNGATVNGRLTVTNSGPNTGTSLQVNAGGQNGLSIYWDNLTPFMQYGLVSARQSRFVNSSSYTFDNNLLIGINTNAGYKLDVNGTSRTLGTHRIWRDNAVAEIKLELYGGQSGWESSIYHNIGAGGADQRLTFRVAGSTSAADKMSILTNGNVGIGTTTPFGKFDVKDGEIFVTTSTDANLRSRLTYQGLYVSRASDGGYPENIISTSSAWLYNSRNAHTFYRDTIPLLTIGALSATAGININTNGNVLINSATDAGYKLDVNGNTRSNRFYATDGITLQRISFEGFNNQVGIDYNSTSGLFKFFASGNNFLSAGWNLDTIIAPVRNSSGGNFGDVVINVGGSERARFKNTGNLLINTTTDVASSQLTIESTTKGFLPPRMSNAQMLAIATPAEGLIVYDTTNRKLCCYDGVTWQNLF